MSDKSLSKLRSQKLGFVFQNYSLIEHLRVWENIELPLIYAKSKLNRQQRDDRIEELLKISHTMDAAFKVFSTAPTDDITKFYEFSMNFWIYFF